MNVSSDTHENGATTVTIIPEGIKWVTIMIRQVRRRMGDKVVLSVGEEDLGILSSVQVNNLIEALQVAEETRAKLEADLPHLPPLEWRDDGEPEELSDEIQVRIDKFLKHAKFRNVSVVTSEVTSKSIADTPYWWVEMHEKTSSGFSTQILTKWYTRERAETQKATVEQYLASLKRK